MGNKRQKRLAKLKKDRNIRKNNMPRRRFMWLPTNKVEEKLTVEDGQNVLHPRDIDPDWETEEARQEKSDMEEDRLKAMEDKDLNR